MDQIDKLENKYKPILLKQGINIDNLTPDQALDILNISIDKSWFTEMNKWDYITAFFAGAIGAILINVGKDEHGNLSFSSKNSYLHDKLDAFHDTHSKFDSENSLFRKVFLSHKGDNIDIVPDVVHLNNISSGMHRLFSGHDLLQFSGDNILIQMFQQYGILGLFKSISHLFYDFCSSMGIPLPGSSNFGLTLYTDWCKRSREIYQKFFTLKAQDLFSTGATFGILKAYRILDTKYWSHRNHSSNLPVFNKINLIAYSINLGTSLLCGTFNYFAATAVIKNAFQLQLKSWKKAKQLQHQIDSLQARVMKRNVDDRTVNERINDMEKDHNNLK